MSHLVITVAHLEYTQTSVKITKPFAVLASMDKLTYVTEFAKRGLIHASIFPTFTNHNFICKQAIKLNFSVLLEQ